MAAKKKKNDTRLPTLVANYSITSVGDFTVRGFHYIHSCLFPVVYFNSIRSAPSSTLCVHLLLPPGYFFCRTRAYPALRSASLIAALALYFFLSLSLSFLRAVKVLVLGFFFLRFVSCRYSWTPSRPLPLLCLLSLSFCVFRSGRLSSWPPLRRDPQSW